MIQPFDNAIQYMEWDEINCCKCKCYDTCDIRDELMRGLVVGTIPDYIARRAGLPGDVCLEIEAEIA